MATLKETFKGNLKKSNKSIQANRANRIAAEARMEYDNLINNKRREIFKIENEMIMTAWISCDDVESHRIQFKTFVFDASAEEAIEDFLTSENP